MITRNKVFYSLSADNQTEVTKKNRINSNPSETTDHAAKLQPVIFYNFSQSANNFQLRNAVNSLLPNPPEQEEIRYLKPLFSYEEMTYKTDYIIPGANITNPNF